MDPSICLSIYLSFYLSVYLSIYLYVCLSDYLPLYLGCLELVHRMLGMLRLQRLVEFPEAERCLVRLAAVTWSGLGLGLRFELRL